MFSYRGWRSLLVFCDPFSQLSSILPYMKLGSRHTWSGRWHWVSPPWLPCPCVGPAVTGCCCRASKCTATPAFLMVLTRASVTWPTSGKVMGLFFGVCWGSREGWGWVSHGRRCPRLFWYVLCPDTQSTFFRWSSSCSLASSEEQMVRQRWRRVLMMPNLWLSGWLLVNCRYCFVCVSVRYTVKHNLPLRLGWFGHPACRGLCPSPPRG